MTEDIPTLQIFAAIGFVFVAAVIISAGVWLLVQIGRWLER